MRRLSLDIQESSVCASPPPRPELLLTEELEGRSPPKEDGWGYNQNEMICLETAERDVMLCQSAPPSRAIV